MMNSVYKVLTPAGQFDAIFAEDEDIPIEYSGDELAIDFFKDWLFINQISGSQGHLLDSDQLTPADLYGFCQPLNSGIEVIPPFDDFMSYMQEDIAMQNDEELAESEILDGVYSDADKKSIAATNQLIKFFREFIASDFEKAQVPTAIYGWTATAQVMDKEDAKRRLRELIDIAINRKAGIEDITPKQKQRLDDYRHDARVISDYLTKRIRHTGARNLLRTPEMKAKFPDIDNQPREEFDSAIITDEIKKIADMMLDGISGMDKIKLIKEAGSIRVSLKTVQSGMEKLKMVKRIKEIREALGVGSSGTLDKNGLDADGMWPMTRAEYDKIHSDFKGTLPDGTLTALKLINGATTVVPVKITGEQQKDPEPEADPQSTMADVNEVMPLLKNFIGAAQLAAVSSLIRGEEGQFFNDKLIEIANVIQTMPKTYGQDGMGDKAIAYLHYFKGSGDWYITEKDMEDDQIQAFGLADIFGDGGELGYINIEETIQHGVELDLHWTPKTLGQIKSADDSDDEKSSEVDLSEFTAQGYESGRSGLGKRDVPQELTDKQKEAWKDGVVNYYRAEKNAIAFVQQEEDKKNPDFEAIEQIKKDFSGAYANDLFRIIDRILARKSLVAVAQGDTKSGFISELESLKAETDIIRFNERLDEIAARVEQAGLMEALDKELNDAADVLTLLLAEAEKN